MYRPAKTWTTLTRVAQTTSENWKSYVSHNDKDSDVSFESDNDEEVDAAEIEEEDWIECIKKEFQWSYENDERMRK